LGIYSEWSGLLLSPSGWTFGFPSCEAQSRNLDDCQPFSGVNEVAVFGLGSSLFCLSVGKKAHWPQLSSFAPPQIDLPSYPLFPPPPCNQELASDLPQVNPPPPGQIIDSLRYSPWSIVRQGNRPQAISPLYYLFLLLFACVPRDISHFH